ncbi:restriction endonuclease [Arthrobacter sp. Z4-13]
MTINTTELIELITGAIGPSSSPRLLHDVAAELILQSNAASDLDEAFELAEPLLDDLKRAFLDVQAISERQGVTWTCEVYGSDYEYLRGSSFADQSLSADERRVRAGRNFITSVQAALLELTPNEFERACTQILQLMGCAHPRTSPVRDDGGLDFYGKLELKGRLDTVAPYGGIDGRAAVWLIGQAKHYPVHAIQTAVLRELVGSVELARTRGAIHAWEGLDLRPFDPVIQLIFTTGRFSAGALRLLEKSGMLSMDGRQLATFLCDAGQGIDLESNTFSKASFRAGLGI